MAGRRRHAYAYAWCLVLRRRWGWSAVLWWSTCKYGAAMQGPDGVRVESRESRVEGLVSWVLVQVLVQVQVQAQTDRRRRAWGVTKRESLHAGSRGVGGLEGEARPSLVCCKIPPQTTEPSQGTAGACFRPLGPPRAPWNAARTISWPTVVRAMPLSPLCNVNTPSTGPPRATRSLPARCRALSRLRSAAAAPRLIGCAEPGPPSLRVDHGERASRSKPQPSLTRSQGCGRGKVRGCCNQTASQPTVEGG